MDKRAAEWFEGATSRWTDWTNRAAPERRATSISVVIPARNEAETIGDIVTGIHEDLIERGLVDELLVIDSDSSDATARIARDHGAVVHAAKDIRPDLGWYPGKGEALWKSQFVASGDVLVFIDADLTQWGTHFVTGLIGPLLRNPAVSLVKGFYDRLLDDGSSAHTPQGGRVTELVARPLLNLHWPALTTVVQPLAGEWAVRRDTFETLTIPTGYGIELAVLLDVYATRGLDAIAQVDLGERAHAHQSVHDLAVMATELLTVAGRRLGLGAAQSSELWQFERATDPPWRARTVPVTERPPGVTTVRRPDAAAG